MNSLQWLVHKVFGGCLTVIGIICIIVALLIGQYLHNENAGPLFIYVGGFGVACLASATKLGGK